jgi:hypothetical protein
MSSHISLRCLHNVRTILHVLNKIRGSELVLRGWGPLMDKPSQSAVNLLRLVESEDSR